LHLFKVRLHHGGGSVSAKFTSFPWLIECLWVTTNLIHLLYFFVPLFALLNLILKILIGDQNDGNEKDFMAD
jgi:hypothetical protein